MGIIPMGLLWAARHEGVFAVVRYLVRACMVALLLASAVSTTGCAGMGGASIEDVAKDLSAPSDSSLEAWPMAAEAMDKVAPDAVLMSVGSGGLALADVPESWDFTFYSDANGHLYKVSVQHGKVEPPTDLGGGKAKMAITQAVDLGAIKVGAAQAVVKAREFGSKTGSVPKNVVVSGFFATSPATAGLGVKPGAWHIIFSSGTDLADAQKYDVDMMSGAVSATPSK